MKIHEALGIVLRFLNKNNADEETMKAFDTIRNTITEFLGGLIYERLTSGKSVLLRDLIAEEEIK